MEQPNAKVKECSKYDDNHALMTIGFREKLRKNKIRDEQHFKNIRESFGKCSDCSSIEHIIHSQQSRCVDINSIIYIRCANCLKELYKFET